MSTPLIACVIDPPRPIQNVVRCSRSLVRSGSSAFAPRSRGRRTSSAPRTRSSVVNTLPTPTRPSSVWTATRVCTTSSCRSSSCQPPSGVAPRSPAAVMAVILMGVLSSGPWTATLGR
ncbi:Uncharacterised protein [Mycobacteroides abscessus]|nr:Uncharacterised protein [Mycobacteroides abscessus]